MIITASNKTVINSGSFIHKTIYIGKMVRHSCATVPRTTLNISNLNLLLPTKRNPHLQLLHEWVSKLGIRKKAAFDKLITSSQKSSFAFLSYKTKANRKRNAVNNKLDSILNYFAINNYWKLKRSSKNFSD